MGGGGFSAVPPNLGFHGRLTNLELSLNPSTLFLAIILLHLGVALKSCHELLGDHIDLLVPVCVVSQTNQGTVGAQRRHAWFLRAS